MISFAVRQALGNRVVFYEGNGGTQNIVCTISASTDVKTDFNNDHYGCSNDEARSMMLSGLILGSTIAVFDGKWDTTGDDWATVYVEQSSLRYVVDTFHTSYEDEFVKVTYHKKECEWHEKTLPLGEWARWEGYVRFHQAVIFGAGASLLHFLSVCSGRPSRGPASPAAAMRSRNN